MTKKNIASGGFWAVVFAFFYLQSTLLKEGAALWPKLISAIGFCLSVSLILFSLYHYQRSLATSMDQKERWAPFQKNQAIRSLVVVVILMLWAAALKPIGFLTSSVSGMCAIFLVFESQRTKKHALRVAMVAVLFGVGMYTLFKLLGVYFPTSLLI